MSARTIRCASFDAFADGLDLAAASFGRVEPKVTGRPGSRSASRRTSNLSAYDLYLRAYAMSFTYQLRQALALLEEAIAPDPHYGPALGLAVANL